MSFVMIPQLSISLKGSYRMSKGAAMAPAPVGSPGRLDDAFSIAFSNYLQFPLVPQLNYQKWPFQITANFPWFPQLSYQLNFI